MTKTIFEPFRIKSIEPIKMTSREERKKSILEADYNVFKLKAEDVMIDLLTDSGTSAMSTQQWAAIQTGDESYAGSPSYFRFIESIQRLMPFTYIFPTHQGRAAERILARIIAKPGARIPNNTHFDTTRANFEAQGIIAENLPIEEGLHPELLHPFKGNMDVTKLENYLAQYNTDIPLVMLTITNNANGGQPVSLENTRAVKKCCVRYNKPLFIDGCRFAENAYFIKTREAEFRDYSIANIVKEIFTLADGMTMSAKKDPFGNIGGWIAMNDEALAAKCRDELIISEGFPTYGGLAGRDLEALAIGVQEAIDEHYLAYRIRTIEYFGERLVKLGIPIIQPVGGHAIFIDAKAMLPHIPALEYPGHALTIALYEIGGVRGGEIGSVMFGKKPDGKEEPAKMELIRLALPRRVYTQSHIDYVIECLDELNSIKSKLRGYKINWEPKFLRHFTAKFEPL